MGLSDWNDKALGARMGLSTDFAHEGLKSLRIQNVLNLKIVKILNKSEVDTPKDVTFDFWSYFDPCYHMAISLALFSRYQDLDNFYAFLLHRKQRDDVDSYIELCVMEAGVPDYTEVIVGYIPHEVWAHWKLKACEVGGTMHFVLLKEEAAIWVEKADLSDYPAKWTGGGALGVGSMKANSSEDPASYVYLDETRIYYE